MLELQQPYQMPHALDTEHHLPLPSISAWPHGKQSSRSHPVVSQVQESRVEPAWLRSSSSSGPLTPPTDMNSYGAMEGPIFRGSQGSAMFQDYSMMSSLQHPPITKPESPQSQRRLSNGASYDNQSATSSPQRSSSTSPSLNVPDTVRTPQQDLSELAAEVSCLFWFEIGSTLQFIERGASLQNSSPLHISPDVVPTTEFRRWVSNLLTTTQVTQNVVLLALLFIYKLKLRNPGVRGQLGSEYRLLTVALMLGNKFLDDNTYTNKTWAEVSSIKIEEVHIMEVEFLSNMRYSLFTSEEAWKDWHVRLGKFGTFISNFIKSRELAKLGSLHTAMASNALSSAVHSPVARTIPPYGAIQYNGAVSRTTTPILLPQLPSSAISPIGPLPEVDPRGALKRLLDDSPSERPSKRHLPSFTPNFSGPPVTGVPPMATSMSGPIKGNLPSLVIPPFSTFSAPTQLTPTLPPPGTHAMSLVFPPVQSRHPRDYPAGMVTPVQTTSSIDHMKQLSPFPPSANSSPISAGAFPTHLSPSFYLAKRSSPYRPVRRVQHLIANQGTPPVYNAPRRIGLDQMQYHSLGQPLTERHVGHLPYINRQAWAQNHPAQNSWAAQS